MQPCGGVQRVKQVVRERDPVARGDGQDLVLDVAEECGICDAVRRVRKKIGGVEGQLVLVVAEDERAARVRRGEHDHQRAEHVAACWRIGMGFEERSFTCCVRVYSQSREFYLN